MRDDDDRALIVAQHAFECFAAVDIEIVGRFVEQQDVGRARHQSRQHDAAPLPAGKIAHGFVGGISADAHAAEQSARLLRGQGGAVEHGFERALLEVELLVRVLSKVRDLRRGVEDDRTAIRMRCPGEYLQKRRLSRAVRADDAQALSALDVER